jgi:hypothetical protein
VGNEAGIGLLRDQVSGFSHRCRNVLNGLKMSLFLIKREAAHPLPSWWAEVEEKYRSIEVLFDQLQAIYRPLALTPVRASFGSLVQDRRRSWSGWFETAGRTLAIAPPDQETAGEFDPMCLGAGLDAFVGWRVGAMGPEHQAHLTWTAKAPAIEVVWHESRLHGRRGDGRCRLGEAQQRTPAGAVASLALPLLARVITAHQGSLEQIGEREFEVVMRWPLSQRPASST